MNTYHSATLPNGLRIIHEASASDVVYCGYVVRAGTRHEDAGDSGMAHFIEHMSFKGTQRRRAWHISNGLERVGGDLNAFTTKQETVYHATVLRPDFGRAADLLTDIVFHSTYPQHEITREVEVICDEIESYADSPSEIIFDEFESMLFEGQSLGRDILGRAERLRGYTTADALRYVRRHYRTDNAVFFVYGNVDFGLVERTMRRLTMGIGAENAGSIGENAAGLPAAEAGDGPAGERPYDCTAGPYAGETRVVNKDTHQAHVLVGGRTFGGSDPRRFALILLNNMLGGPGMNSRLNMKLREHAGLVYSIEANLSTYPDTGWWSAYFGCDPQDIARCRRMVERELRRFIDTPLTPAQLAAAKKQLAGQIGISLDAGESRALALGKCFAHYGHYRDTRELLDEVGKITPADLQETAAAVYTPERITTLIYR